MIKLLFPLLLVSIVLGNLQDNLVNLQTDGELRWPYVSVDSFSFGDSAYTIMFQAEFNTMGGTKTVLWAQGLNTRPAEDPNLIIVQQVSSNQFRLCFGLLEYATTVTLSSGLSANTLYSFTIIVQPTGTLNEVNVNIFVNTEDNPRYSGNIRGIVAHGTRTATLGAQNDWNTGAKSNFMNGMLDNFVIISDVVSVADRKSLHSPTHWNWSPSNDVLSRIALWIHFNDAILALENTAVAITKIVNGQSDWVTAVVNGGGTFQSHGASSGTENWRSCRSWGDPHYYDFNGAFVGGGEKLEGHRVFQSCDNDDFEIRSFTRFMPWWCNTVFRVATLKFRDFIWRMSLDETGPGGAGVPFGRYVRVINQESWSALGDNTFIHGPTGIRYQGWSGRFMRLSVPDIATFTVEAESGNFRYMNLDLTMNLGKCVNRRGSCDRQLFGTGNVFFHDLRFPNPLPDIPPEITDPCDGVEPTILKKMEDVCGRYYPSKGDLYNDCVFDACSSGDPDIIPDQDLTPECQLERLTGVDNSVCVNSCQGNCFGRGDCLNGECVCDTASFAYGGFDCFQPDSYTCHTAKYSTIDMNVEPRTIFDTQPDVDHLKFSFTDYSVWQSLLIYPATYKGQEYLQFVVNSPESDQGGSFTICMTATTPQTGAFYQLTGPTNPAIQTNGPMIVDQIEPNWAATNGMCVEVRFSSYQVGGFYFEIDGSVATTFTFKITQSSGLKQVLIGSQNNRGGLDVSKVPAVHLSTGFNWDMGTCQNSDCYAHDQNCGQCYATAGCGFCQETQRCMSGTQSGPRRGVCKNWRYGASAVSRVVTTKFNGDDLVDPDYEVFLSEVDDGVPVSIYVPTLRTNNNIDVQMMFGTKGTYAANAGSLKTNLLTALAAQSALNLGIGYYGDVKAIINLDLTVVDPLNHYLFARALEAPVGTNAAGSGGQFAALLEIKKLAKFRKFARRLAVFTVYDLESDANLAAARKACSDANIFPVWLIPRGVANNVVQYWTELNDRIDGIPSLVIRIDQSGSDFQSAFRQIFLLSASFPHVVIEDISDNDYNHVDKTVLTSEADSLSIAGLTNSRIRARFNIPMKHNSVYTHHVANIIIPGFGHSLIEDVAGVDPIITGSRSFSGFENQKCIQITLAAETFNNLASPVFEILDLPSPGKLHLFDSAELNNVGDEITAPGLFAQKTFCFVPVAYDHSAPASAVYASFSYQATDGCYTSNPADVDIYVTPVYEPPTTDVQPLIIKENDQETPASIPDIDIVAFEADKDDFGVQELVTFEWSSFSVDYMSQIHGAAPVNFYSSVNLNPGFLSGSYGPYTVDTNFEVTQTIRYNPPNPDFFGTFYAYVTLRDNGNKVQPSAPYPVIVQVVPVNDIPTASVDADAVFDPTGAHQWVKEDSTTSVYIIGEDIDNFAIGVDIRIKDSAAGTASALPMVNGQTLTTSWLNNACVSTSQSGVVICEITYTPPADYFSCGDGSTISPNPATLGLCAGTPAVTLEYRVNDRNANGFRWGDLSGAIQDGVSAVQTVAIHVLSVNDPPLAPPVTIVEMVEDQGAADVVITVEDIDSQSSQIDMFVSTICPQFINLTQQDGTPVNNGDEIQDRILKRYTQDHKFIATTIANLHGTDRNTNWEICRVTTTARDDELASLTNGYVSIRVRPYNDEPFDLLTYFEKAEDVNEVYNEMDLTADDIDNTLDELTYVITQLPWYDIALGEGVVIHAIDPVTGLIDPDVYITQNDLPYTVAKNASGYAKVWVRSLANWYGRLDADDEVLIYTVTDVDAFLTSTETGHKINTVESKVEIYIPPVNDRPITTVSPAAAFEDTVQVIYLLGVNDKYGEGADNLTVTLHAVQHFYSDSYTDRPDVFFHYDDAWYNQYVLDAASVDVSDLTPLLIGQAVVDNKYRILFIPPQNMNKAASRTETPLFIAPRIQYQMIEVDSHAPPLFLRSTISDWFIVTVNPVNDVPVTWGGEWNVESNPAYDAFYGGNAWSYPAGHGDDATTFDNTVCIDDCYYTEDFGVVGHYVQLSPREIKFGGRDVEGDDLQVVIRSVNCQAELDVVRNPTWEVVNDTGRFSVNTEDLVGMTLGRLVERIPGDGYKLVSMLTFAPARNDWNVPAEFHENDASGQESSFYCQLTYAVVDSEGLASDDNDLGAPAKTITLQVRQQNDQPTDTVLQDPLHSSTLIGYEDRDLFIKFDASDVEGDDFTFAIHRCNDTRGTYFFPKKNQADTLVGSDLIDENGHLRTPSDSNMNALFDLNNPVDCRAINNPDLKYSDTRGLGWFVYFRPNKNDYGNDFSTITVSYDDDKVDGQDPQYSDRFIHIRPVNDAPVINLAGNGQRIIVSSAQPVNLGLSFEDVDASTTDGQEFSRLGFQLRITKADLRNPNKDTIAGAYTYNAATDGDVEVYPIVNPVDANNLGLINWRGSVSQSNEFAAGVSITFKSLGDYTLEIVAADAGALGYCAPEVVRDTNTYANEDIRSIVGVEGQFVGPQHMEDTWCNRVTTVSVDITVNVAASIVGGIASGAGAGLLALLALGAVVFAKLNKPEDLDAWQALDNAQFANAQQSGIHIQAKTGGTSTIYEGK